MIRNKIRFIIKNESRSTEPFTYIDEITAKISDHLKQKYGIPSERCSLQNELSAIIEEIVKENILEFYGNE